MALYNYIYLYIKTTLLEYVILKNLSHIEGRVLSIPPYWWQQLDFMYVREGKEHKNIVCTCVGSNTQNLFFFPHFKPTNQTKPCGFLRLKHHSVTLWNYSTWDFFYNVTVLFLKGISTDLACFFFFFSLPCWCCDFSSSNMTFVEPGREIRMLMIFSLNLQNYIYFRDITSSYAFW